MPVPSAITDLSTTPGSNSPSGSEAPTEGDNHLRTAYAFIRTLYDTKVASADLGTTSTITKGVGMVGWDGASTYTGGAGLVLYANYGRTAAEIAASVTPTNYHYAPGDVRRYGAALDGTTDDTTAVQRAHDQGDQAGGARPFLPAGTALITTAIDPCVLGMYGLGSKRSLIKCNGVHCFNIPSNAGWDRPAVVFEKFGIDSNNGTSCDAKFAFNFPGVSAGATAVYNSGVTIRDIEIGRNQRFGGGFYIKDVFRLNVENVGFTSVSRMIQIVGSVVQCKFRNVTANNDSPGTGLSKYGISTESATYDTGTLTPENIRFIDCSYIRGTRGISHAAGLLIEIENFDTEADDYGAHINAPIKLTGGILAPGTGATAWVGIFRGVSISDPDDATIFEDVDINCLRQPGTPSSSYGIDMGDNVSPVRGVVVQRCRFRGVAGSLQSAIRGRIVNDLTLEQNFIRTGVVTGTNDVDLTSVEKLIARDNRNASGVWSITDGGSSTAYGEVSDNELTTLTFSPTTITNWTVGNNSAASTGRRKATEYTTTFTGSLTGCTTTPTGTVRGSRTGYTCTLLFPDIQGTSNTTAATITGMPAELRPARTQIALIRIVEASAAAVGLAQVATSGTVTLFSNPGGGGFTASGTKGVSGCSITYSLE